MIAIYCKITKKNILITYNLYKETLLIDTRVLNKEVDVVLPLKTRCHAALPGLYKYYIQCIIIMFEFCFVMARVYKFVIELIMYFIICELLGFSEVCYLTYLSSPAKPPACFSFLFA